MLKGHVRSSSKPKPLRPPASCYDHLQAATTTKRTAGAIHHGSPRALLCLTPPARKPLSPCQVVGLQGTDPYRADADVADIAEVVEYTVTVDMDAVVGVIVGRGDGELATDRIVPGRRRRAAQAVLDLADAGAGIESRDGHGHVAVAPAGGSVVCRCRVGGVDLDRAGAGRAHVTDVVQGAVLVVVDTVVGVVGRGGHDERVSARVEPGGRTSQAVLGLGHTGAAEVEAVRVTVTALFFQAVGALSVTVGLVVSMRTVQVPVSLELPRLSRAR